MPTLVNSPEELTAANVVGNTINSVGMFAGPAIAGILLALSGPAAAFAFNGALFIWSAIFIAQVPRDERPNARRAAAVPARAHGRVQSGAREARAPSRGRADGGA